MTAPLIAEYLEAYAARHRNEAPPKVTKSDGGYYLWFDDGVLPMSVSEAMMRADVQAYRDCLASEAEAHVSAPEAA